MEVYRVGHSMDDVNDVERMSGVKLYMEGGGETVVND